MFLQLVSIKRCLPSQRFIPFGYEMIGIDLFPIFCTDYRERCPHGWLAFDEFCYLFVSKSNGRWEEFPQKCNKENGLLAMPKTDGEVQFLQNKIVSLKHRTKNFYIGLRKKGGIWTWIDDVPYTRDVDVKDELGNKNCAALFEGSINMISCREPKAGYICEIRKGNNMGFGSLSFCDNNNSDKF